MTRVVTLAGSLVGAADQASVSLHRAHSGYATPWASAEEARVLDRIQYRLDQGPCVEAIRSGSVCHIVLGDDDSPFPDFAREASPHAVGSVISTPLVVGDDVVGALNVYSRRPEPFPEESRVMAAELAELAAAVLAVREQSAGERWREALDDRDVIFRSQGVLMAWQHCGADEAFAMLRRTSVREDRPVADVARGVLASVQRPDG